MDEATAKPEPKFDPTKHLMNLKGKSYLPVFARIAAFRDAHPIKDGWGIFTTQIAGSQGEQYATFHAEVTDPEGRIVGSGTKSEDVKGFSDYAEKYITHMDLENAAASQDAQKMFDELEQKLLTPGNANTVPAVMDAVKDSEGVYQPVPAKKQLADKDWSIFDN